MAHNAQRIFVSGVKEKFPYAFDSVKVLEIGSLNINGSIRDLFDNCFYIGLDLDFGPCVDLVASGDQIKFSNNFFNTAISCECFEHNPYWRETFDNMVRMSSDLVVMTCATEGRAEHGTIRSSAGESPFTAESNYYKNLIEEDFSYFDFSVFKDYEFSINSEAHDLYFWGIKNV